MIKIHRVYETQGDEAKAHFLVERLWPRGIRKETLHMDAWLREVAPSNQLRRWFGHDPARWEEFQQRYTAELDAHPAAWQPIVEAARRGDVSLLYSARDTQHNNAMALKAYLEKQLAG
jgi:uncharacterized protein YeaO (DUF488 family)